MMIFVSVTYYTNKCLAVMIKISNFKIEGSIYSLLFNKRCYLLFNKQCYLTNNNYFHFVKSKLVIAHAYWIIFHHVATHYNMNGKQIPKDNSFFVCLCLCLCCVCVCVCMCKCVCVWQCLCGCLRACMCMCVLFNTTSRHIH